MLFRSQVVDEKYQQCPLFIPGEIIISGAGVANGYLNKHELTKDKFVEIHTIRSYKSSDLAIDTGAGELVYLARTDQQIKLNGFRVELGEIETQLSSIENIKQACVFLIDDQLIAFLVLEKNTSELQSLVQQTARDKLAYYMQPKDFSYVTKFPLTVNGKLDRSKLTFNYKNQQTEAKTLEAELIGTQKTIHAIWLKIFQDTDISLDSSFFELGGDSIKVLKMSAALRELGYTIKPSDIYKNFTIRKLSSYLESALTKQAVEVKPSINIKDGDRKSVV